MGKIIKAAEVAARYLLSLKTVYRLTQAGMMPAYAVTPGDYRYDEDEVEKWFRDRRVRR